MSDGYFDIYGVSYSETLNESIVTGCLQNSEGKPHEFYGKTTKLDIVQLQDASNFGDYSPIDGRISLTETLIERCDWFITCWEDVQRRLQEQIIDAQTAKNLVLKLLRNDIFSRNVLKKFDPALVDFVAYFCTASLLECIQWSPLNKTWEALETLYCQDNNDNTPGWIEFLFEKRPAYKTTCFQLFEAIITAKNDSNLEEHRKDRLSMRLLKVILKYSQPIDLINLMENDFLKTSYISDKMFDLFNENEITCEYFSFKASSLIDRFLTSPKASMGTFLKFVQKKRNRFALKKDNRISKRIFWDKLELFNNENPIDIDGTLTIIEHLSQESFFVKDFIEMGIYECILGKGWSSGPGYLRILFALCVFFNHQEESDASNEFGKLRSKIISELYLGANEKCLTIENLNIIRNFMNLPSTNNQELFSIDSDCQFLFKLDMITHRDNSVSELEFDDDTIETIGNNIVASKVMESLNQENNKVNSFILHIRDVYSFSFLPQIIQTEFNQVNSLTIHFKDGSGAISAFEGLFETILDEVLNVADEKSSCKITNLFLLLNDLTISIELLVWGIQKLQDILANENNRVATLSITLNEVDAFKQVELQNSKLTAFNLSILGTIEMNMDEFGDICGKLPNLKQLSVNEMDEEGSSMLFSKNQSLETIISLENQMQWNRNE